MVSGVATVVKIIQILDFSNYNHLPPSAHFDVSKSEIENLIWILVKCWSSGSLRFLTAEDIMVNHGFLWFSE